MSDGKVVVATLAIAGVLFVRGLWAVVGLVVGEPLGGAPLLACLLALAGAVGLVHGLGRPIAIAALLVFCVRFTIDLVSGPLAIGSVLTAAAFIAALVATVSPAAATVLRQPLEARLKMVRWRDPLSPVPAVFVLWFVWVAVNFGLVVLHLSIS